MIYVIYIYTYLYTPGTCCWSESNRGHDLSFKSHTTAESCSSKVSRNVLGVAAEMIADGGVSANTAHDDVCPPLEWRWRWKQHDGRLWREVCWCSLSAPLFLGECDANALANRRASIWGHSEFDILQAALAKKLKMWRICWHTGNDCVVLHV